MLQVCRTSRSEPRRSRERWRPLGARPEGVVKQFLRAATLLFFGFPAAVLAQWDIQLTPQGTSTQSFPIWGTNPLQYTTQVQSWTTPALNVTSLTLTGANVFGGGTYPLTHTATSQGSIRATLTWRGGGTAPGSVWVLISCTTSANASVSSGSMTSRDGHATNGLADVEQITTNTATSYIVRSQGLHLRKLCVTGGTAEVTLSPSAYATGVVSSGRPSVSASIAYSIGVTDRQLVLSRLDGGDFREIAPSAYEAHTTYSGMASLIDIINDPAYAEKNRQDMKAQAMGTWGAAPFLGVIFNWDCYRPDQPEPWSPIVVDRSTPFENTQTSFLPYGVGEAIPLEFEVTAKDEVDGAEAKGTLKWIIHKQIEAWEVYDSWTDEFALAGGQVSAPEFLDDPTDSISIAGSFSIETSVTTTWEATTGLTIEIGTLTSKSFGDATVGGSFGRSTGRSASVTFSESHEIELGPKDPGWYAVGWVIPANVYLGTTTYWNRKGEHDDPVLNIWIPDCEHGQPSLGLVYKGPP